MLLMLPLSQVDGFIYPHYMNGAVLQVATLVLFVFWMARAGARRARKFGAAEILLGLFTLCVLGQVLLARNFRIAIISAANLLLPIVWALLLGRLLPGRRAIRFVACGAVFAGTLAAYISFFFVLRKNETSAVEWVFGHRNFLAFFLVPTAILALTDMVRGLFKAKHGPLDLPPFVTAPILVVVLVVIGICGSIGGFLGVAAGTGALLLFPLKNRWRIAALVLVFLVGIAAILVLSQPSVEARIAPNQQFQRWFLWKGAVRMFLEHPWTGWGPGMFQLYFADFKPTAPMRYDILTSITYHPHNEYLLIAVEDGLLGLGLYLAAFIALAAALVRKVMRSEDASERYRLWALGSAFAAMMAHGTVTVALRYWAPVAVFWTVVGLMLASTAKEREPKTAPAGRSESMRIVGLLAGLVVAVVGMWCLVIPGIRAEWLLNRGLSRRMTPAERAERCRRASELSRYPPDYLTSFRLQATERMAAGDLDGAISTYEDLWNTAPGYGHLRPVLAGLYTRRLRQRGTLQNAGDDPDIQRAIELLQEAASQNPWNAAVRIDLARALMIASAKNIPAATEQARAAVEAGPENANAHLMLSTLLLDSHMPAESVEHAELAQEYSNPADTHFLEKIQYVAGACLKPLQDAVRQDPRSATIQIGLARALMMQPGENTSQALEHARAAVEIAPENANAHLMLARVLMTSSVGNISEAIEHTQLAVKTEPKNANAHLMLSTLLLDSNEPAEALEHVRLAEKYASSDHASLMGKIRSVERECLERLEEQGPAAEQPAGK